MTTNSDFGLADGLLVFQELVEESVEVFLLFDFFEDAEFGAEAMFDAVLSDFGFGLGGLGATGSLRVAAIGRDLFGGCHGCLQMVYDGRRKRLLYAVECRRRACGMRG
ncbi:MAG TPA: hypothetical protein VF283_01230 [Bryobacteraceae bacterium]